MKRSNQDEDFSEFQDDDFSEYSHDKTQGYKSELDLKKLKPIVEEWIEAMLIKKKVIEENGLPEPRMISLTELSKEWGVSRQTINNWSKHRDIRGVFFEFRKSFGKRFVFDADGLKKELIRRGSAIGLRYKEIKQLRNDPTDE